MTLSLRSALRVLKRSGKTAEELWREHRAQIIQNAREGGWRDSELAASLAELYMDMEVVFGKRVMQKADAAVKGQNNGTPR